MLKHSAFKVLFTDKDGGMGIERWNDWLDVVSQIVDRPEYKEVPHNQKDKIIDDAHASCLRICGKIQSQLGLPGLLGAARKFMREPRATCISTIKCTLKSHKPHGEVSHIALHTTPCYSMMGLSLWVQVMRNKHLESPSY